MSAIGIEAGAAELIGTECGCERHVRIWQAMGIWLEDGRITPEPGDIIVYNWDDRTQPNDGFVDHVGYVESVRDGVIHTIEGNRTAGTGNPAVRRMELPLGHGQIRGFARSRYESEVKPAPTLTTEAIARQVIAGKWGAGEDRRQRLQDAGYDPDTVQAEVNRQLGATPKPTPKPAPAPAPSGIELPTIRTGSSGDTVRAMQGILIARGYLCGGSGADGICGPGTVASISRFQADHDLQPDGICGSKTWRRLLGL